MLRREEILLLLLLAVGAAISVALGGGLSRSAVAGVFRALAPSIAGFFILSRWLTWKSRGSADWLGRDLEFLRGLVFYVLTLVVWANLVVRLPLIRRGSQDGLQLDLDSVLGFQALGAAIRSSAMSFSFFGLWPLWALVGFFALWLILWRWEDGELIRRAWIAASLTLILGQLLAILYPVMPPYFSHQDALPWLRDPGQTPTGMRQVILSQARFAALQAIVQEAALSGRAVGIYAQHFVLPASQLAVLATVVWNRRRWLALTAWLLCLLTWLGGFALGWGYGAHGLAAIAGAVALTWALGRGREWLESEPTPEVFHDEDGDVPVDRWWHHGPSRRRALLRILIYPWLFFFLVGLLTAPLRRSAAWAKNRGFRWGTRLLGAALYLGIALPATVLVTGELLITANELVIAEQADYRLQSDFEVGYLTESLDLPGPNPYQPAPVDPSEGEAYYRYLTELYAPVFLQKMSHHPEWDVPLLLDYDGNLDPRDNVVNTEGRDAFQAGVHGEVTGITEDSIYLTYSLYHAKDYDHPIRERISRWTYHDNDNEGLHLRVDRATGQVAEVEAWFHNRFLLFNHTGTSTGSEPVHGRIHVEGGTHVVIYAQPQGHGVRCAQYVDRDGLDENVKILRYRGDRPAVPTHADHSIQIDATYELDNFDSWYEQALGPFGKDGQGTGIFEETIDLGPELPPIGRFIAGRDYDVGSWSRPKPMWSWDDGWDSLPILVWHFFPDASFRAHGGSELSSDYVYNRPSEKVFQLSADEVRRRLRLKVEMRGGDKWDSLEGRGGELEHRYYWQAVTHALKGYVNYLFHALG